MKQYKALESDQPVKDDQIRIEVSDVVDTISLREILDTRKAIRNKINKLEAQDQELESEEAEILKVIKKISKQK